MNGIWGLVVTSVGIASVVGALYLIWSIGRFPGIQKITKDKKILKFLVSLLILGAFFGLFCLTMSVINAVIILIHVMLFRLIFDLAGLIVKLITKKKSKFYWQGWGSFIASFIYLAIAFFLCNHVFTTVYNLDTDKAIGNLKIVMFADSHIGATFDGDGFMKEIEKINTENPDIVFIAGDFVDDSTTRDDMLKACEALGKIEAKYGVWYAYGNHDKGYSGRNFRDFSASELYVQLGVNHVHVMEDKVQEAADGIVVVGRADASNRNRKSIQALTEEISDDKYIIVIDHQPTDYENESSSKSDLVLSGHTHGGQFFPITLLEDTFAANNRTYGYEKRNGTDFIVTSGIADWELKFKTGTKSEYVVINVKGK